MNALKHAFPGEARNGRIVVSYRVADGDWKLTVSDDGIGHDDPGTGRSDRDLGAGLGTSLIQALAKQLDARVGTVSNSKGTAVSITHATFKAKPPNAAELLPA